MQFDKETDESFRWVRTVDGVKFQLYIYKERVRRPVSEVIEVSIFSDRKLYTKLLTQLGKKSVMDLTRRDREDLDGIGLDDHKLRVAGDDAILGAAFLPPKAEHIETVRYNAHRKLKELEFGDPYIPKSVLSEPYPERLLFLVRWLGTAANKPPSLSPEEIWQRMLMRRK